MSADGMMGRWMAAGLLALVLLGQGLPALAQTTVEYIHTDALGSPVAVTNQAGQVIERNDYEPYGAMIGKPDYQGIGYTGHVQDAATGLTYMQQRYYDPLLGRFLSRDPVTAYSNGDMRFFNAYAYAFNNPYAFKDPDGRETGAAYRAIYLADSGQPVASSQPMGETGELILDVVVSAVVDVLTAGPNGDGVAVFTGIRAARAADKVADTKKVTGTYTNTHKSGTRYHGKGSEARMNKSAADKAKANNDPVAKKEHTPAANSREAFKEEARRIEADGGPGKGNYNQINSPGKKYLEEDRLKK